MNTDDSYEEWVLEHPQGEDYSYQLFEFGVEGVEIVSDSKIKSYLNLRKYPRESFILKLNELGYKILSSQAINAENWIQNCPEVMQSIEVGAIKIAPQQDSASQSSSSCDAPALHTGYCTGQHTIRIIPGMGFGTGHHESTRIALQLLQDPAISSFNSQARALDVGAGSGVLAIAAAVLYGSKVVAVESDAAAVANCVENIALNSCAKLIDAVCAEFPAEFPAKFPAKFLPGQDDGPLPLSAQYDLVLANLYAELQVQFEPHFATLLKCGGFLILSGIMRSKHELVLEAFPPKKWRLIAECSLERPVSDRMPASEHGSEAELEQANSWIGYLFQRCIL